MARVAVVGARGFVGTATATRLTQLGHELVPIRAPRLAPVPPCVDVHELLAAYSSEVEDMAEAFADTDAIINCAGNPDASSRDEAGLTRANGDLVAVLGQAALLAGTKRFIHVSSAVVQGRRMVLDDTPEVDPYSPYARSKIRGELLLLEVNPGATVYRPPSVHAPGRRVTRLTQKLARSRLSSVAAPADSPSPQALLENVADAVCFLATCPADPPRIVTHPWEGVTTGSLLHLLGGRPPLVIPRPIALAVVRLAELAGRAFPVLAANARRVEMLWFGQGQADSWLTAAGWTPPRQWGAPGSVSIEL